MRIFGLQAVRAAKPRCHRIYNDCGTAELRGVETRQEGSGQDAAFAAYSGGNRNGDPVNRLQENDKGRDALSIFMDSLITLRADLPGLFAFTAIAVHAVRIMPT